MKGRYMPGIGWINQLDFLLLIGFKIFAVITIFLSGAGVLVWSIYAWEYLKSVFSLPYIIYNFGILGCFGLSLSVIYLLDLFWTDFYNEIVEKMKRK